MTNNRTCSTESRIEDRCKGRSSSDDGIDQLFFAQFALDKLFKEEPRISRPSETVIALGAAAVVNCFGSIYRIQFKIHVSQMLMDALLKRFED